jgi:hypothetical protein
MNLGLLITIGVVAGVVILVLVIFLIVRTASGALVRASGLPALIERYRTDSPPPPNALRRQTVAVGKVNFKNCVLLGIGDAGLYLDFGGVPLVMPRKPPVLIPWGDLRKTGERRLFWKACSELSIGQPSLGTITVFDEAFQRMRPHLSA